MTMASKRNFKTGRTTMNEDEKMTTEQYQQFRACKKEAGRKIDPKTAETMWRYGLTMDPYGVGLELSEEAQQVGREYFARSLGGDDWVNFDDLPEATIVVLWARDKRTLAFPAGLEEAIKTASECYDGSSNT
jgi:hypothetical protein